MEVYYVLGGFLVTWGAHLADARSTDRRLRVLEEQNAARIAANVAIGRMEQALVDVLQRLGRIETALDRRHRATDDL